MEKCPSCKRELKEKVTIVFEGKEVEICSECVISLGHEVDGNIDEFKKLLKERINASTM